MTATYPKLTERAHALLTKHRRELIRIARRSDLTAAQKEEARQALTNEVHEQRAQLRADIEQAQSAAKSPRTKPDQSQLDPLLVATRWTQIEKELDERRTEVHSTVTELARAAAEGGDAATLAALRNELPGYVRRTTGRDMPQEQLATATKGLQALVDQAAGVRPKYDAKATKDAARLTLLANALTAGIDNPDSYAILPDFKDGTMTVDARITMPHGNEDPE